jgi:peptidoglycan/xylan/chitin deacetylase (PgdA/CDA1 family)
MYLLSVNYHYFREEKPQSGIYPLTLKEFSNQIDELSKYYEFISQNDLIAKIKSQNYSGKKYCLLTFDDGLKEQMEALELLNKKGIPGVFYVTTSAIRTNTVLNVHKLHYIRSIMKDIDILKFISSKIDLEFIKYPNDISNLYIYDNLEAKKLKYLLNFILGDDIKNKIISELFDQYTNEKNLSKELYMDISDIQTLNNFGYLGTHGDFHMPLATLNNQDIESDISSSLTFFKNNCGIKKINSISYPYGGHKAISKDVVDVSKKLGLTFGLTMFRGINNINDLRNPLLLKRVDTNDAPGGKMQSKEFCI